jgi:glucose-6-phosphate 1-dehydrogenase
MANETLVRRTVGEPQRDHAAPCEPCVMVIFGASGDLTKRLLMPALYNLACDGLLPKQFAIIGIGRDELSTDQFRGRLTEDIKKFNTRKEFKPPVWEDFVVRLHYLSGDFADAETYRRLGAVVAKLDAEHQTRGNVLYYMATPPAVFAMISANLSRVGSTQADKAWRRLIVEKPFGQDLPSAIQLNRALLTHWSEEQIFRIDHYLGKETVQNLLAFRFANGVFEPLWNKNHGDHIQLNIAETVGVEGRGGYYDRSGVVRDMIQNHLFQMLAYVCMEPPASFRADAVRNEKAKLLDAVRVLRPEEVADNAVRGQYGPGKRTDGTPAFGYREETGVDPKSCTETFAALKVYIDNWRWEGVPIYLRSGKRLWKRGTEIVVQFKKAPEVIFRDTPAVSRLESNKLIFHIQPDQGIEFRFHAKTPGPAMSLQKVNMRFDYREAFEASRGTGYEVLLYNCMIGDATLFSRTDLVESAWRIVQPVLDAWVAVPPQDYPNYAGGSWGPKAAFELIERDGRRWVEVVNREVLEKVPLFQRGDPVFLHSLAMTLKPIVYCPGELIIRKGEPGREMYFISRGQVEVFNDTNQVLRTLEAGDFFGELSLLLSQPRAASVRAVTSCDLFVLEKGDFDKVLKERPEFAEALRQNARKHYGQSEAAATLGEPR